jgi:hypothetical protein
LEPVSLLHAGRIAVITCVSIAFALAMGGCIDNTVVPPSDDVDSALPGIDSAAPSEDAGSDADARAIDGSDGSLPDASLPDASLPDASLPDATSDGSIDAGKDAATRRPSQLGLVAGGTVSHSAKYTMAGTAGPATAPVQRSGHYQLVGGMAVTAQKP